MASNIAPFACEGFDGWTSAVYFLPSIGPLYESGLAGGKRVLLLGESHYASNAEAVASGRQCTRQNFDDFWTCGIYPGNRFWGKLQRIAARNVQPTKAESQEAWKRLAFANFVQQFVGEGPRQRPTRDQWKTGQAALTEIVQRLRPHAVLVLGGETWNHITEGEASGEPPIEIAGRPDRSIWLMPYEGGYAKSTWIYHPATGYDSNASAIKVFAELLDRVQLPGATTQKLT
jgi:G:T/U-mismatch repair DNA glycosylase